MNMATGSPTNVFLQYFCEFNPFNAALLSTLASPPLNSWRGGG